MKYTLLAKMPEVSQQEKIVAITGSCEFLGSSLVSLCEKDQRIKRVIGIDTRPLAPFCPAREKATQKTSHYRVDLTTEKSVVQLKEIFRDEKVDSVIHTAFLPTPTFEIAWAHELECVGTSRLTQAAGQTSVNKFILYSQTMLYGARPSNPNFLSEAHPLRADLNEPFFADKINAEAHVLRYKQMHPQSITTLLRMAPLIGPRGPHLTATWLKKRCVITLFGFDPMMQFLHEKDAVSALHFALFQNMDGIFNIVGDGVLPLSQVLKLTHRVALPLAHSLAELASSVLWLNDLGPFPPSFLSYLRYIFVARGLLAKKHGYTPMYSTREALLDFYSQKKLNSSFTQAQTPSPKLGSSPDSSF